MLTLFPTVLIAQDKSQDKQWLRLLHYRKTWMQNDVSEADGPKFFLHPEGRTSPKKELQEFLSQIQRSDLKEEDHPLCRFPARSRWVKKNYPEITLPLIECANYTAFKKRTSSKSISLVFSSYYLNNPASSFGHTFLRLGKSVEHKEGRAVELLDTGINYGAVTGNAGPVVYMVGGLSGLFPGTFNALPYYYKVREYNDYESRDLWNYHLNFSELESEMVTEHLWELGQTYFDYYFLTENCSYHMLTILETVRPDMELVARLPFYIIPSDTLKAIHDAGIVDRISFRASAGSSFFQSLTYLSKSEREQLDLLIKNSHSTISGTDAERAVAYDAAIDYVDYRYAKDILKQDEKAQEIKRPLLLGRSKVPFTTPYVKTFDKEKNPPHAGHPSRRLMLGLRNIKNHNLLDMEFRFAFHDFLDLKDSYPDKTIVEVGRLHLTTDGHKLHFYDADVIHVQSIAPVTRYQHAPSWKMRIGQWDSVYKKQMGLSTFGMEGGVGYSYSVGLITPYLLAHFEAAQVSEIEHRFKLNYGVDLGLLFDVSQHTKLVSVLQYRAWPWLDGSWMNEARWASTKYGVGGYFLSFLSGQRRDAGVRFYYYFQ